MNHLNSGYCAGARWLRIVVLDIHMDLWCDACAALSVVAITYLVEERGSVPQVLSRLVYCTTCDGE